MNKQSLRWWIVLGVLAVVYNVVVFALPFPMTGVFWLSWAFTMAALGVQIYVIPTAFRAGEGVRSKFYGFPILRIGAVYLAVQTVLSLLFMALGALVPVWIPLVIYVVLLGGGALGFIGADAAREEVERQEERVIRDTSAMQGLRARSAALAGACPPALAGPVGKLADDLRFSDPVSSPATASLEGELGALLDRLEGAVAAGDGEQVQDLCRQAGQLLDQRNRLCKLNK